MSKYHLIAGILALVVAASAVGGGFAYARHVEDHYIKALAPQMFSLKNQGTALQDAAFRQPDLLPIYGSSELDIPDPYHGSQLFAKYPTGFTIFPVGKAGTTDLIILQDLAAIGPDVRGKKVAISLSAPWFFGAMPGADSYAGNYSLLHAYALVFSTEISFDVKRDAAKRMLQYPRTLAGDPVLKFALERLADGSMASRIIYYLMMPLGQMRLFIIQAQDHWDTLALIRQQLHNEHPLDSNITEQAATLDWPALLVKADQEQRQVANNNPFGFDNGSWQRNFIKSVPNQKNSRKDAPFLKNLHSAAEWTDLELLIRGAKDMGVHEKTLRTYLKELEEQGVVVVTKRGQGKTNLYRLPKFQNDKRAAYEG